MDAAARLKAWLSESDDWTMSSLSAQLGITYQRLHNWTRGTGRPPLWVRVRIEELTAGSIRPIDWLSADERAALAKSRSPR